MSTKGMYTLREDKQELTKQLGCMNGIFQLFDRRYLLGQKKLPQGGKTEINNTSEKPKEKTENEKHRVSTESSRNSFSSSCSSLDCSKRVQTEPSSSCPSIVSEPLSPTVVKDDIKNVVKNSMTRKPRVVSVKTVAKDERKGPTMTHIDSPRPVPFPYDRKDQNLDKLKDISKGIKEISRFSCDGRESIYKLKSVANVKDMPRFSLDSKQSCIKNYKNTHELVTNKRPGSSSVIARLMGLEALDDVINGGESLKIKPCVLDDKSVSLSRPSSNKVVSQSPRIPLEPAPWKQEGGTQKELVRKKARERVDHGCHSVYGQIEKRLTEVEFKSSGKDLRALKQILEAIQRTKVRLENTENKKIVQSDSMVITNAQKVKKVNRCARNLTPIETKVKKPVSPSRNSGTVSPRSQRSGIEKQPVRGIRKQSKGQLCNFSSHVRNLSQQSDISISLPSESDTSVASQNEPEVTSKDWSEGNKMKFAERLSEYKTMAEQPSPVSVLDAFYTEETLSPVKKKSYAFKDGEDLHFDEQEWSQVGIDNLAELNHPTSGVNTENIKQLVDQIELLTSKSDEAITNPHENGDQKYIKEILLASGFFKNLDCATTIIHLHPTGSLINPELFNILEKNKNTHESKSSKSEKMRRKMIFDSVNEILVQILSKRKRRILNGEKIVMELWSEINKLQTYTGSEQYDEILNIIAVDVNKKSEDWDDNCNEVPDLALDIERLIFKDLISEIVNDEGGSLQDGPGKHCRQLFLM